MSKIQQKSVIDQLREGVRIIDLNPWITLNGIFLHNGETKLQSKLEHQLTLIRKFCDKYPKEIVIILIRNYEFDNDIDKNEDIEFINDIGEIVADKVGDLIIPNSINLTKTRIKNIYKHGRVLVYLEEELDIVAEAESVI